MVKCEICNKMFIIISNTHLDTHGYTVAQYRTEFPDSALYSSEFLKQKSLNMMGKNKNNPRPDAKVLMTQSNPMKKKEVQKKVSQTRKKLIASGKLDVMSSFNHLPTQNELQVLQYFNELNIPLRYVGDGSLLIGEYCPDFINEDLKIAVELNLNYCIHPYNKEHIKEKAYAKYGYHLIWLQKVSKEHIISWILPFFNGGVHPVKVKRVWKESIHDKRVYNLEVTPNNTYLANRIVVHNCYANAFRASLYTAFFDNSKTMGLRHCNPSFYKEKLDAMEKYRAMSFDQKCNLSGINKAFALDIPVRMGIRFEDFLRNEYRSKTSLEMLNYLADISYPVMINSKSDVPGMEEYVSALSRNKAGAAIHFTLISSNNELIKRLEPGAPTYAARLQAMKNLTSAGVRVVARIEPYLFLTTDDPDDLSQYMDEVWATGTRNITFDTYSYTALNQGIRQSFINVGLDFDRIYIAGCDSQPLGSLLLGKFMELFRDYGFSCSTFDLGNVPSNDQAICCEVGDWFKGGFNYGCTVMAARFIKRRKGRKVCWSDFDKYVQKKGGWLTEELKMDVKHLWNLEGNVAYSHRWAIGMIPVGRDEDGLIWSWESGTDYRMKLLESMI
jgi:hypothetical protein